MYSSLDLVEETMIAHYGGYLQELGPFNADEQYQSALQPGKEWNQSCSVKSTVENLKQINSSKLLRQSYIPVS